jgi:hypothetical protein
MTKYGCFALERVHGGVLKLPSGETKRFDSPEAAARAWTKWLEENALPEAVRETRRKREKFAAGCTLKDRRIKQSGILNPDVVVKEVYGPDEELLGELRNKGFEEFVDATALQRFLEPTTSRLKEVISGRTD